MYMRGTSHVSGSPVLLFFCWWYSLLESHWICGSNEFSNYGYVSVDIRKKRKVWFKYRDIYCSCTDPRGSNFDKGFLVDERIKIPLSAGHHRPASETPFNAVSLAGWWVHKIKCWLDRFVIFQGIRTSIAKKPYIFVMIFQRGSGPPAPPPLWIRPCCFM